MLEKPRRNPLLLVIWIGLISIGIAAALLYARQRGAMDPRVCDALARADLRTVITAEGAQLSCDGVRVIAAADATEVETLLRGTNAKVLGSKLRSLKATGIAVQPGVTASGVLGRLTKLEHVAGLRGIALSPDVAVYAGAPDLTLDAKDRDALAYVARALFRGAREPNASSFPPALRRVERVEVMVALSDRGEPRLWRSARGTSIARALLTATRVARERWRERESAMGGPLLQRLNGLDVEVSLLEEDGTLAHSTAGFVDRAITAAHGVGFDYRSDWHYSLPTDVARQGKGSAFRALSSLAAERGLPASVLTEPGVRLYRFVPVALGVSRATATAADSANESAKPSGGNSD